MMEMILSTDCKNSLRPAALLKKENLAQVFSREFCRIFKNTLYLEHFQWLKQINQDL